MKYLIKQTLVGYGRLWYPQWGEETRIENKDIFENVFIPSMKKYCYNHNYEYDLCTEYNGEIDAAFGDTQKEMGEHYCMWKYLNLEKYEDYDIDAIALVDTDILALDFAKKLPNVNSLAGLYPKAKDAFSYNCEKRESWFDENKHQRINGSVTLWKKDVAIKYSKWLKDIIKNNPELIIDHTVNDEFTIAYWAEKNNIEIENLPEEYNNIKITKIKEISNHEQDFKYQDLLNENFIHFLGVKKEMRYKKFLKRARNL